LANINYDEVFESSEKRDIDALPLLKYEDENINLELKLYPVSKELQNSKYHRPIGGGPMEFKWMNLEYNLRNALHKKSSKYSKPDCPFLISLNYNGFPLNKEDIINTLFGTEEIHLDNNTGESNVTRDRNGFWLGKSGAKNTSVSAVLFSSLNPYNLHVTEIIIFHNPWARYPYEGNLNELTNYRITNGELNVMDGKKVKDLINIPNDWPGDLYKLPKYKELH
jgi:hypothetical protein